MLGQEPHPPPTLGHEPVDVVARRAERTPVGRVGAREATLVVEEADEAAVDDGCCCGEAGRDRLEPTRSPAGINQRATGKQDPPRVGRASRSVAANLNPIRDGFANIVDEVGQPPGAAGHRQIEGDFPSTRTPISIDCALRPLRPAGNPSEYCMR